MIRYFAPEVIDLDGHTHHMAIAQQVIQRGEITIMPYTRECHSTLYIGRRIQLIITPQGLLTAKAIK